MNKELEALEDLWEGYIETTDYCRFKYGLTHDKEKANFELIKSALERKEKLEKAWEITKNSSINFHLIKDSENYNRYIEKCFLIAGKLETWLTETEFNLLKEMLEEK